MINHYSKFRQKLASCGRSLLLGGLVTLLFGATPGLFAGFLHIDALEVEEGTYFPEDPVPMAIAITSTHPTDVACYEVHVHLTPDTNFRTSSDHMLHILVGSIAPGETVLRTWTQMMPGNLPGTFFVNAEVTTCHGSTPAMSSPPSRLTPAAIVQTAKITLAPQTYPETEMLSVARDGAQANGVNEDASISDDGRFVAFASESTTLLGVARDEDGEIITDDDDNPVGLVGNRHSDIYVRDNWTGEIERISTPLGASDGNGPSYLPRISADGNWVVFHSLASNLVPGDSNGYSDVYARNRTTGELRRVSVGAGGTQGNQASQNASISGDGRWIVFESEANNLLEGDTNNVADIFLYDTLTGGIVKRVNVTDDGVQAQGGHSRFPRISADGRHIVFESRAGNLTSDPDNGLWEIYVHDRDANGNGVFDEPGATRTTRLSVSYGDLGERLFSDGHSRSADLTNDGRFVVFQSESTQLAANPAEGAIVLPGRSAEAELSWSENEEGIGTIEFVSNALAEGTIAFTQNPTDGELFELRDGDTSRVFEFDGPVPNGVAPGHIRVFIGGSAEATRNQLVRAINRAFAIDGEEPGTILATADDNVGGRVGIHLVNLEFGPVGNQPIDGTDAPSLVVNGMSGAAEPIGAVQPGDELEIDHSRTAPVTIRFYSSGDVDPTDYAARITGVEIGRTSKGTSLNLLQALHDLGYHAFDGKYLPEIPEELIPPLLENPAHGDLFVLTQGEDESDPDYFEETFTFVENGPQFNPFDPRRVRIGASPQETRGNLLRSIYFLGFTFEALPAYSESGEQVAFGALFNDAAASGAIALTQVPEDGHLITISDGFITTNFRFEDERDLTEEEEDEGFILPPFEIVGPGLVRIYLFDEISLAEVNSRLFNAIQSAPLGVMAYRGFSEELERDAILLLNLNVGAHGNVPIVLNPLEEDDEEDPDAEPSPIVAAEWALAIGMDGGLDGNPDIGERVVFYPEDLLHPSVTFEFVLDTDNLSPDADFAVQIGADGAETEGNFLGAIHRSGLPWLIAEGPEDPSDAMVRLRSILAKGDGSIAFNFSATNSAAFAFLGDALGDRDGVVHMPFHGGILTLNDRVNPPVTFEFTYDGSVLEEDHVPVAIAPVGALTRDNLIHAINQETRLAIRAEDASDGDDLAIRLINTNRGAGIGADYETLGPISVSITDAGGWNPRPGEAFRLGDASGNSEIFEFVLPGDSPAPGRIGVETFPVSDPGDKRTTVRDRIAAAIKQSGLQMLVVDDVEDNSPAVFLQQTIPGPAGNVPIQVFAANPSFTTRGMSGGAFLGTGREQIFLVDRDANRNGIFDQPGAMSVELISVAEDGRPANGPSLEPAISGNGRFVVFRTLARNLQPRSVVRSDGEVFPNRAGLLDYEADEIVNFTDVDPFSDLYVHDREDRSNRRITVNRFGEAYVAHAHTVNVPRSSRGATINYDGNYIAYESDDQAYNQPHRGGIGDASIRGGGLAHTITNRNTLDNNGFRDIFMYDRRFPTDAPSLPGEVVLSLPAIVQEVDTVPTVTVGSPVDVLARVEDLVPGRTASFVQFFANGNLIGVATQPVIRGGDVFAVRWVPGAATTYRLVAVATDSFGRSLPMSAEMTVKAEQPANQISPTATVFNPPIDGELVPDNAFPLTNRSEWPFVAAASSGQHTIEEVQFIIRNLTPGEVAENEMFNNLGGISIGHGQKEPAGGDGDSGVWRLNFDLAKFGPSGLPAGYYGVHVLVRDSAGNLGSSPAVPIVVSPSLSQRPSVTLSAQRREMTRMEFNRFRAQADSPHGQISPGGEVYLFANGTMPNYEGYENPQTSRPFEWEGNALYSGTWNFYAVARDNSGNTAISNVIRVVVHPFGNIVGNPADPEQNTAFVFQMYDDLLMESANSVPSTEVVRTWVTALETGALTRGDVIAAIMDHPDHRNIRFVIAAYLTVLRAPPTYPQLVEGVEILRGGGDDDQGSGDDDEGGNVNPGVPAGLRIVISDILSSEEFRLKHIVNGSIGYDDNGQIREEDLVRFIWRNNGTYQVMQQRLREMQQIGRAGHLANATDHFLRENAHGISRDTTRVALIMLLLQRDTSLAEASRLPRDTVAAANYIVSSNAFMVRHQAPSSFLLLIEDFWNDEDTLFGWFHADSGMYVKESAWLGYLNDVHFSHTSETGWIKHTEHNWVYFAPNSVTPNGVWLWDDIQQEWLWTSATIYPLMFSDREDVWLYYEEGGAPSLREFQVHDGGAWNGVRRVSR